MEYDDYIRYEIYLVYTLFTHPPKSINREKHNTTYLIHIQYTITKSMGNIMYAGILFYV